MLGTIEDIFSTFKNKKWMALESVRDPGNLGTVIRTAEAMGVDGLLLSSDCCDVYSPKVLRGSMGGVFRLPIVEAADMAEAVETLQKAGLPAFACVPFTGPDVLPVTKAPLSAGCLCVVGNEANGLTQKTVEACRYKVTIPMAGRAESLNAAVAAAIMLWEMVR
jgi:TrmH family RNA methyltransferase